MKPAVFLLLSMAALAWADSTYTHYQNQQNNYPSYYEESAPSNPNYYQYGAAPAQRRQSFFESVQDLFFPSNRRLFTGVIGIVGPIIVIICIVVVVSIVVAVASSSFSSSGRGLDTDEWEVDHSVWMNQLQKDFEDSWSTE